MKGGKAGKEARNEKLKAKSKAGKDQNSNDIFVICVTINHNL